MSILIVKSEFLSSNEYYVFRPLPNEQYEEIAFKIRNGIIIQNPQRLLKADEIDYIKENII